MKKITLCLLLTAFLFLGSKIDAENIYEKIMMEQIAPKGGFGELNVNDKKITFDSVQAEILSNEPNDYTATVTFTQFIPEKGIHIFYFSVITEWAKTLRGTYTTRDRYGDAPVVTAVFDTFSEGNKTAKIYVNSAWNEEKEDYDEAYFEITINEFEKREGGKIKGTLKGALINGDDVNEKTNVTGTFSSTISPEEED